MGRGHERPGLLDANGVIRDLSGKVPDIAGEVLLPASLDMLRAIDPASLPPVTGNLRVGPCVGKIGKIIGVGLNYKDHAAESNMPIPSEPPLFLKACSALTGPDDEIEIPSNAEKVDWEVELVVVIGKSGKSIPQERALDHVAGYCVGNDVSERAFQLERGGQWDKGKGCDTFAPLGPWLVTRDEVPDPQALDLWLEVDGRRFQHGNTRNMIFDVTFLVAYIGRFMSLQSGDLIFSGTPAGVGFGQRPPIYLRAGQTVRLGIAGLGTQQQSVIKES